MNDRFQKKRFDLRSIDWIIKSLLKSNLWFFGGVVLYLIIRSYLEYGNLSFFSNDQAVILMLLILALLWNLPSIVLYLSFAKKNEVKTLEIDWNSNSVTLTFKNGSKKSIKESEVSYSVYNMGIYYKNWIDGSRRLSTFFSDLGYWELHTNSGSYFIPSILGPFLLLTPVFETQYRFRYFPIYKSKPNSTPIDFEPFVEKSRYDKLKEAYTNKSRSQLESIIKNHKDYQELTRKVAQDLLNERSSNQ